jgi:hypothetical protein
MQKFLTLRNGRKVQLNTPEEDAAITAAALADWLTEHRPE